ncbi:MAG: DeoR/GlpR family DNA-binding transcription regulator [Armatimonadota bacterium]
MPEQDGSSKSIAMGKLATSLVSDGETVMVDSGPFSFEVALQLPREIGITLATTSLGVAQALYGSRIKILLLGGFLRDDCPSLFGPLTEQALVGLTVDTLFVDCDGADSREGFYVADLQAASLKQAMIRSTFRVVVVADSSKFSRRSFARFAVPQQVQYLVTDSGISPRDRANLEERGVKVMITEDVE